MPHASPSAQSNGYLVLQGNMHFRTARSKKFLKLLARKRLGTRWAKYPFSLCRMHTWVHDAMSRRVESPWAYLRNMQGATHAYDHICNAMHAYGLTSEICNDFAASRWNPSPKAQAFPSPNTDDMRQTGWRRPALHAEPRAQSPKPRCIPT